MILMQVSCTFYRIWSHPGDAGVMHMISFGVTTGPNSRFKVIRLNTPAPIFVEFTTYAVPY
jgi:hypothetical protein